MIVGAEFNFVVQDTIKALELYEQIFDIERLQVTDFSRGENEVIFSLYGMRFHMLDENPTFHLFAPKPGQAQSSWINVTVPNIHETFEKAIELGCTEVQPVTEYPQMGMANALFSDPFGYVWMLHEITDELSEEEIEKGFEEVWEMMQKERDNK